MRELTREELGAAREALMGPHGEALRLAVFDRALERRVPTGDEVEARLRDLDWIDAAGRFTELGELIKDPVREYSFWLERGRQLPSADQVEALRPKRFHGKRLLELGSGGGCNLLSLSGIPSRLVGVEPMALYVQMTEILASLATVPAPEVVIGQAEALPFEAGAFDVCICYSSHQYMDIDRGLAEMARVLVPGGEVIIVGNSLFPFAVESAFRLVQERSRHWAKHDSIALVNTLAYELLGRRLIRSGRVTTTGRPVYPSHVYMKRRMRELGLVLSAHRTKVVDTGETALVAVKT